MNVHLCLRVYVWACSCKRTPLSLSPPLPLPPPHPPYHYLCIPVVSSSVSRYNVSFPPLSYATKYLAAMNGCNTSKPAATSFKNGTVGNATVCRTWQDCDANVTSCLSDGGHTWYGQSGVSAWGSDQLCRYQWCYDPKNCTYCDEILANSTLPNASHFWDNTFSINESAVTLAFFAGIQKGMDSMISSRLTGEEQGTTLLEGT